MNSKAGPSKRKIKTITSTSRAKEKSRQSDNYDSEGTEKLYSHEEELSSSEGSSSDSDLKIFNLSSKPKTICSISRAHDTPAQPLKSSESKRGLSEPDSNPITESKRLKPGDGHTGLNLPGKRDAPAQSSKLPDSDVSSSASMPAVQQNNASLFTLPVLNSEFSISNLTSDNDLQLPDYSHNNSPFHQGASGSWSSNPHSMKIIDFTKEQQLLVPPPTDPYQAFRLLIDNNLLDLIVHETNANALRMSTAENVMRKSRINNWKNLTREELLTFLGLVLHTGTIRLNRISDYWKRHYLFNIPCFGQFMSRNRFLLILRCLQFTSEPSDGDRLNKIRPIVDHFNNKMKAIYCPGKELALYESTVLWRGRLLFRQYIRNKRHKYGIKLYVLAEPGGTVLKYQVSAGANDDISGQGHANKIVLKLLEDRLDCGHHVYMDSYYNSYGLAAKLLERQTYCTGTLRKNCKDNPVEIGTMPLQKGENKSFFMNGVHIGKWRAKREVLYISTEHGDELMETTSKTGSVIFKPTAIIHYNNFMSGVDLQDQMLAYYPVQRKALRWHKKLFVHMLQMSLSNAFYLYNQFALNDKMNLYDFRLKVLEMLLPDTNEVKRHNVLKMKHELTKVEKTRTRQKNVGGVVKEFTEVARKECKGCRAQKKRVQTIYECKQCEGSPGFCTKCFCLAHS